MRNVIYTERFFRPRPDGTMRAGFAFGPLVFIRPKYRNDLGLHEHEQVHVRQWFRTFGLHGLFYIFSARYRFAAEAEAYRCQYLRNPERLPLYASYIVERYRLDELKLTTAQAAVAIATAK